jgi:hypothetical protein
MDSPAVIVPNEKSGEETQNVRKGRFGVFENDALASRPEKRGWSYNERVFRQRLRDSDIPKDTDAPPVGILRKNQSPDHSSRIPDYASAYVSGYIGKRDFFRQVHAHPPSTL